jgi:hypothetical protein
MDSAPQRAGRRGALPTGLTALTLARTLRFFVFLSPDQRERERVSRSTNGSTPGCGRGLAARASAAAPIGPSCELTGMRTAGSTTPHPRLCRAVGQRGGVDRTEPQADRDAHSGVNHAAPSALPRCRPGHTIDEQEHMMVRSTSQEPWNSNDGLTLPRGSSLSRSSRSPGAWIHPHCCDP